jgi:hypothetical protein
MKKFEISMKKQFKIYIHLHNSAQNIGNNSSNKTTPAATTTAKQ